MLNSKKLMPYLLLVGQIVCMTSVAFMAMYGNLWQWSITLAVYVAIMLSVTMGYHRLFAHKAYKCPIWLQYVMLFFAGIPFYGPAIGWVAHHREHHRYADSPKDPHSPFYSGVFAAYFLQVLCPVRFKYVPDLLRDSMHRKNVKYYWHMIFAYLIVLYLIDPFAIVYAYLAPAGLSKIIGGLVFTYSHRNLKANSDTWVGILTLGEGFHEIHHKRPGMHRWHKLDLGGKLIEVLDNDKITQKV